MAENAYLRLRPEQAGVWLAERTNVLVLDAREAHHHATSHLAGCIRLDGRNHEDLLMREPKNRPVLTYCHHGSASQTYASMFTDFGFSDVADLIGGWAAIDCQLQGPQQPADIFCTPSVVANACTVPAALAVWLAAEGFDPSRPDCPGQYGNTPLQYAAWRGATGVVSALLELGVAVDTVNGDGNNALWLACVNGEPSLIRLLVAAGVPIDHANLVGATALMYGASSGKQVVVATLLDLGANPNLLSQDDFSALDMAANVECLQLLRAAARRQAALSTLA